MGGGEQQVGEVPSRLVSKRPMSPSSPGATAVRATRARSPRPWCALVSATATLTLAQGTLVDLSSPSSHQLHLGIMNSSVPPPGVVNVRSQDSRGSIQMSFRSLAGSDPLLVQQSVQEVRLVPQCHPLVPQHHLQLVAQQSVALIPASHASSHSDMVAPSTTSASLRAMPRGILSRGAPH